MMNSLREENSDIITPFKINNEMISNYLSILMNIPYSPQRDQKEIDIINNSIEMLLIYKHKTSTTIKDNENIYKLINSINISNLFEISLSKIEKDYCENEIIKYINDPEIYQIPDLDKIIDNGDFLKCYIIYRISNYNQAKRSNDATNLIKKI